MVLLRGLADDVPLNVWLEEYVWPIERSLKPEDVYWGTLLGIAEAIRGGTTCVAVEESGIRAVLSYGMIAETLNEKGRAELARAKEIAKRWDKAAQGRIRAAISPHAVYTCGEDVWREALKAAADLGVPIHTHLCESRREVEEWKEKTGLSPVAYLDSLDAFRVPTIAAHSVHVDEEDMAILAERGVSVVHCPKSNAKLGNGIARGAPCRMPPPTGEGRGFDGPIGRGLPRDGDLLREGGAPSPRRRVEAGISSRPRPDRCGGTPHNPGARPDRHPRLRVGISGRH